MGIASPFGGADKIGAPVTDLDDGAGQAGIASPDGTKGEFSPVGPPSPSSGGGIANPAVKGDPNAPAMKAGGLAKEPQFGMPAMSETGVW